MKQRRINLNNVGIKMDKRQLPTINGVPIDMSKDDSPLAISSSMKEDLANEQYDDSPMAISSSMKEDIARDSGDDRPLFGSHWDED